MYLVILLLVATTVTGQGKSIESSRHGSLNMYYVYTRDNPRVPVLIQATNASIINTPVLFRPYTAVVVHGHEGSGFSSLNPVVKDAFLTSEDMNVIVVDWSTYAEQRYTNAVNAVPSVGVALAEFIQLLVNINRVSLNRLHLVGFNLGAHVVGFTGRTLNGQAARITGLDPSASQWGSNSQRLRASDAAYVEVIHTDGDGLAFNGLSAAIGHTDFYPNGGGNQPGCLSHTCNHNRAWEFFAATLTHNHLVANQCASNLQLNLNRCRGYALLMGNNDLTKFGSGIFRVNTNRRYPY